MTADIADNPFVVGIDLGTTNSAVSFVDLAEAANGRPRIRLFPILQPTGPGVMDRLEVLPSFLYIPGDFDLSKEAVALPWPTREDHFAGVFARDHGALVPSRLVSSAKSWLCHGQVDRQARILPWGVSDEVKKVSPVQATSAYLDHIRMAWNHAHEGEEAQLLENQMVVLTVPASFDEVARELTVTAARAAGLTRVTLLEEPVAVFYSWLHRCADDWHRQVRPGELILVCDVGGGTTDFTLIALAEAGDGGSPRFQRLAVGNHLILGGDNMDLALARSVEHQMGSPSALSGDQWKTLIHQGRQAKEAILDGASDAVDLTLVGKGSRLIAGTRKATLTRESVNRILLDGFFPLIDPEPERRPDGRGGIAEFGLPYEPEPAITRQLGWFLDRHRGTVAGLRKGGTHAPDWILFNGGALKPAILQDRLREAVGRWFGLGPEASPRVLDNPVPDLAVALGGAYYGMVKSGMGVRVGTGSARSFFVGVSGPREQSGPSRGPMAICLVEKGMEEGTRIQLPDMDFEVLANQPVSFELYSSSYRGDTRAGQVIPVDESLTRLPSLRTVVTYGKRGAETRIPVRIEAAYTEMGTLSLWCRSAVSDHRWQLQFQLRQPRAAAQVSDPSILEAAVVQDALEVARRAFQQTDAPHLLDTLTKDIAQCVQLDKNSWPLSLLRQIGDDLLAAVHVRGQSPAAESRWLNLAGFCLRPGFGEGFDPRRVQRLFSLYPQGPAFANKPLVRNEWWILWRRVAGGLKAGQQRSLVQGLTSVMMPAKGCKSRLSDQERVEIWMAVANMERLGAKDKVRWGRRLLAEIRPKKTRFALYWVLARLGARDLLYGPADCVIPPEEAEAWIQALLQLDWPGPKPLQTMLPQLARRTGDRMRDLDEDVRKTVIRWLADRDTPPDRLRMVQEVAPRDRLDEAELFGESLPAGLVLRRES